MIQGRTGVQGRFVAICLAAFLLAGCASTGDPGDLALANKSGPNAKLKLVRTSSPIGILVDAYVLVDGKRVAAVGNGETRTVRIPAKKSRITVAGWGTLNNYSITLNAKRGRTYVAQISPNTDLIIPALISPLPTAVIDASANKGKGGSFKIRIVR